MSARRTENSGSDRARHQAVNRRRSRVFASLVRPRYPARKPARASRSASVNAGWTVASALDVVVVVIGEPPRTAEARGAQPGQGAGLRVNEDLNVSRATTARHVTIS